MRPLFSWDQCFEDRAICEHPCEPTLPLAQGALPNLRADVPQFVPVEIFEALPAPLTPAGAVARRTSFRLAASVALPSDPSQGPPGRSLRYP